jgi:predicted nucleotidyltransferase
MGNIGTTSIGEVLFSSVQRRVLAILFGEPDRSFYTNEIARRGKTGRGALQRELERMTSSGLVNVTTSGAQKYYSANTNSPIFHELRGIVLKTFGLTDVLRSALSDLSARIRFAFVYGSVAKGADTAASDIDVMVVADGLSYGELFEALGKAEETIGRKISPTLYSPEEFSRKVGDDHHFVTRVLAQPKLLLIGEDRDIPAGKAAKPPEGRQPQG